MSKGLGPQIKKQIMIKMMPEHSMEYCVTRDLY